MVEESVLSDDHIALNRVLGYLEFRKALLQGGVTNFACPTLEAGIEVAMITRNIAPRLDGEIARAAHTVMRSLGAFR